MKNTLALLAFLTSLSTLPACSSGPQVPLTTPVLHISCSWYVSPDAGRVEASHGRQAGVGDCIINRAASNASQETTGNSTDAQTHTELSVPVGALPATN